MKQTTFASAAWAAKGKTTRRERFLAEMNAVMPWARLVALIEPHYPKAGNGRQPMPLEHMLRVYFMPQWFNLSDPQAEDALYDIEPMRRFAGIELAEDDVPDETTILRFRHLLEEHQLTKAMFAEVRGLLQARGLLLTSGTIVDATIISAPSSTKNATKQRDPKMHQTKKGKNWHFGMKLHIGADRRGLVHSDATGPANEADITRLDDLLSGERFVDQPPSAVYAALLDEGRYLCSVRIMGRLRAAAGEVRERRDQLRHPAYAKPEFLATRPNELWSWDITKLLGPAKWTYFSLYVLLDVFSRYLVGWMLAHRESAALAKKLIEHSLKKHAIRPGQLSVHADRGPAMSSKPVALLLSDLGITKTHSWPHVSNDNPYSEAHFKTLKYRPEFAERFGCIEHGRSFRLGFFDWYNNEHYHSDLALRTPRTVHFGETAAVLARRREILAAAYATNPERFVHRVPHPAEPPKAVWISPPKPVGANGELQ